MSLSNVHAEPPPPIVSEPDGINYATGPALGKGGFAICHWAERYDGSRPTGQIVALKIVKTKMEPAKLAQKFVTELQIHSKLSHPNIVTFYRAFSFSTSTYVVLELCSNGSLADMLKRRKYLTLPEIRRLVIQVCGAVKYLHHRHIVHRDLKTGNLFLDERMNVKVGDFGLAALLVTGRDLEHTRRTTMCGTPNYLAPEILEKGKGHDEKVDLWAIGVIAYTLAVGKAPFHASTKEEIYKKLRSGTYAWPELSATTNQSTDLRDLVSSLLVPEELRPSPDKIVSHAFFRIAFVPSNIPSAAKEKTPIWPDVCIPSAEVIRRGYSDTWFNICKESGVGEYQDGKCFLLNNGRKVRSIVHDIQREVQAGLQPTIPLAQDVVYMSNINNFDGPAASRSAENDQKQATVRGVRDISNNEVASARPRLAESQRAGKDAELMPPPPRAASRVGRTGTVRKAARTISEEAANSSESARIRSDSSTAPSETLRVSKTRAVPSAASAPSALRELNQPPSSVYQTAISQQGDVEKPKRAETVKRSADASLARRPRGTRAPRDRPQSPVEAVEKAPSFPARVRERPLSSVDKPGPLATLDELKQVSPFKYRRKIPGAEVVEVLSDPEPDHKDEAASTDSYTMKLAPSSRMTKRMPIPLRKASSELDSAVPGTDPTTVLHKLSVFRDNLASVLTKSSRSHRNPAAESPESLPFVSRWVDYSRKHGVGYVLSDGTVGCIINGGATANSASSPSTTPVAHVLVRNGQRWLQKVGKTKDFEGIDRVPLEILEDAESKGIKRKMYKGLGSVKDGPLVVEAGRRRMLSVLWVKFGRYMCQSLDGDEAEGSVQEDGNFVRFYQRIGSVGVWAFADGCLQIHFPDHTKLVLSSTGHTLSATILTLEATAHLAQHGDLLPQHVGSRQVIADSIPSLLFEGGRVRQRLIRANELAEKLAFVLDVVSQWVGNGGLGCLDEDVGGEKLYWTGLTVRDNARKVDRVTVGRYGGDDNAIAQR